MLEGPPEALLYYDLVCMCSVVILKKALYLTEVLPLITVLKQLLLAVW